MRGLLMCVFVFSACTARNLDNAGDGGGGGGDMAQPVPMCPGGCRADQFCDFDDNDPCGARGLPGKCAPRPNACTREYKPVCGCDGKTYGNGCTAQMGGSDVAYRGECVAPPVPCGSGTCKSDEYCDFSDSDPCGLRSDGGGKCVKRPQICPDLYSPVCGCDGQTYGNSCDANGSGTDVFHSGDCRTTTRACGGRAGNTCGANEFCDFAGNGCDFADAQGTCKARPQGCTLLYAPVCGCDGKDYGNECEAQSSGTDAQYSGKCGDPTKDCRTTGCPDKQKCELCWVDYACLPEGAVC